jgi:hypothetical protein
VRKLGCINSKLEGVMAKLPWYRLASISGMTESKVISTLEAIVDPESKPVKKPVGPVVSYVLSV